MLEDLFKKGYLNYFKLIIDNSKVLGLNAEEAFLLINILDEYLKTDSLSVDELQDQILMSSNKIDKLVATLMERGYYEVYLSYDNGIGKECISFKPLFEKIENILKNDNDIDDYDVEKVNRYISSKINRVLTSSELEILQSMMIDEHYTYQDIVNACDMIIASKKNLTMRALTLALANNKQQPKLKKEVPQAFKDFYNRI